MMGGVETHVFKYADRDDLYFQCQISIFVKACLSQDSLAFDQ